MKISDATKADILMNEYQACQTAIQGLDSSIWQSAALIGIASFGTIALLATNPPTIPTTLLVGTLSTAASFTWRRIADRYWSLYNTKLERMHDIEKLLRTPGQVHRTRFLDEYHETLPSNSDAAKARVRALARKYGIPVDLAARLASSPYERKGPRDRLSLIPLVTLGAWAIFLFIRLVDLLAPIITHFPLFIFLGPWFIVGA